MNIKITHNWLKEYLDTDATPEQIQKYLSLCGPSVENIQKEDNDYIYDIEITSNRIDTASVMGIARETAAILKCFGIKARFKPLQLNEKIMPEHKLPLVVEDTNHLCRRILAIVMDNITIKPSPQYVQKRLSAAGIRSLNNVVDITNYVMTEIGHPTHVFDYDRIQTNKFLIRHAKKNEEIITLDEKKYRLCEEDIIIDDGTGRVIDLPGIMGTENSVVTSKTKRIIFFIEANDPIAIRRSSMRYGIRTVAATINEKSPDPEGAKMALLRGIDLFKQLAGANTASNIIDLYPIPEKPVEITASFAFVNKIIGVEVPKKQVVDILQDLEFTVSIKGDQFTVQVPSFRRKDVNIPEDLVEEIARIYGYRNLPAILQPMIYIKQPKELESLFFLQSKIKYFLKHIGLHEVMNYSMISKEMIENNDLKVENHLALSNTISDEIKYMRTHLLPSLIKNIKDNEGKKEELRFFEIAKTYKPQVNELPIEEYKLGIVTNTDYFDLKGTVDSLLRELNITDYGIKRSTHPLLSNNNQGEITKGKSWIGEFGQLKGVYQMKNEIKSNVFLAVFDFQALINHYRSYPVYKLINQYATIKLDLTIEANERQSYQDIKEKSFQQSKLLEHIEVVSLYKNKLSLRYYFSSPERNITEEEVKEELKKISKILLLKSY